jgi:hypothetical protein
VLSCAVNQRRAALNSCSLVCCSRFSSSHFPLPRSAVASSLLFSTRLDRLAPPFFAYFRILSRYLASLSLSSRSDSSHLASPSPYHFAPLCAFPCFASICFASHRIVLIRFTFSRIASFYFAFPCFDLLSPRVVFSHFFSPRITLVSLSIASLSLLPHNFIVPSSFPLHFPQTSV